MLARSDIEASQHPLAPPSNPPRATIHSFITSYHKDESMAELKHDDRRIRINRGLSNPSQDTEHDNVDKRDAKKHKAFH